MKNDSKNNDQVKIPIPNKKKSQANSQFIRSKLQSQYIPKVKVFKTRLHTTDEHHKLAEYRQQMSKQEASVIDRVIQCCKNRQLIEIDWKTKRNFRKSNLSIHLPRLNTQPLQMKNEQTDRKKKNFSFFDSRLQICSTKSVKYKNIEDSFQKLKDLLYKHSNDDKLQNSITQKTQKSINQSKKIKQSQKSKQINIKENIVNLESIALNQNNSIYSQVALDENINQIDSQVNFKNLRAKTGQDSSIIKNLISNSKAHITKSIYFSNRLNTQQNQQDSYNRSQRIPSQFKSNKQHYDIFRDPKINNVIQKSRQKLISFKQKIVIDSLSNLQKMNFIQNKDNKQINNKVKQSKQSQSFHLKTTNQSIKPKCKKSYQASYFENQATYQTNENNHIYQLKDSKKSHQINDLSIKQKLLEGKYRYTQNSIRTKKKQSLVQAQQRIMKKIKLTFLKEDLTNKFEQIRNMSLSPKNRV